MKKILILTFTTFILVACGKKEKLNEEPLTQKVKVLNVGTFHMGYTTDQYKSEFDPKLKANKDQLATLNQLLAEFKPTIILVEAEPKEQDALEKNYAGYLVDPTKETAFQNETQFIAFEIGRLSQTKKIIGIDKQLGYNYMGIDELAHEIEAKTYLNGQKAIKKILESLYTEPLINRFIKMNEQSYYDAMINLNADLLTYVNTENNFEGADAAGDFYLRNLKMFANINRVKVNDSDRILILSGSTHAAFFDMFMKRSPKYELVPITNYLK